MTRIRVLHVIGPMATGGAQTQLLGLVRAAHGRSWDATVCGTSPGSMTSKFRFEGVPTVELPRWGSPGLLRLMKLRRLISKGDFDVIHSNLWQANAFARLACIGRRSRPAVVISERGIETPRSRIRRWIDLRLHQWTDIWVGNSQAVVDFIVEAHDAPRDRTFLVPNAVDRTVFSSDRRNVGNTSFTIGVVARLTWEKGHEVLIDAVASLVRRGHSLRVQIAGDGPRMQELEDLARGLPIEFVGALEPGAQVASFLRQLDLFVLPSHVEGRPNVVLEALATEVPVIVSDAPGCVEAVHGGGPSFPRGDSSVLATRISEVIADHDSAAARSRRAAETIPDFDRLVAQYQGLFEAALKRVCTS